MIAACTDNNSTTERAKMMEKTKSSERAMFVEKTIYRERATSIEKTTHRERARMIEKTKGYERPTFEDILAVRTLVRAREDFQSLRKKMTNRIGEKADGTSQNLTESRAFRAEDVAMFKAIAEEAKRQENDCEKNLKKVLKRFPIWTEYLENVKGVGTIAAGWIIAEFNIEKATTVSKMWQFAGLNPGLVRGMKSEDKNKYNPSMGEFIKEYAPKEGNAKVIYLTNEMVSGDRRTPGFVAPYNKNLRTALVGVLADGFIKQQNYYCMEFYYPYKQRLEQEESEVLHVGKMKQWKEVNKGHRDRAAKRYMIKMFLIDLYVAWRTIEGLLVRPSYQEEYLGHKHGE